MKIRADEIGLLFREFAKINRETLAELREVIKEKDSELQGQRAVLVTLKDFRDKALASGFIYNQDENKGE